MWKPLDIIVGLIALGLFIFMILLTAESVINNRPMTEEQTKILSDILVSMLGIIILYVGNKLGKSDK